jgi:hypothetical protein
VVGEVAMPKATVTLGTGTKVEIEGSAEEIELLLKRIEPRREAQTSKREGRRSPRGKDSQAIRDYVIELREAGTFKKPIGLTDVKNALHAEGHVIPITTLSGVMLGLVKSKELRRLKEGGVWKYVTR